MSMQQLRCRSLIYYDNTQLMTEYEMLSRVMLRIVPKLVKWIRSVAKTKEGGKRFQNRWQMFYHQIQHVILYFMQHNWWYDWLQRVIFISDYLPVELVPRCSDNRQWRVDFSFNSLFRLATKKTRTHCITDTLYGTPQVTTQKVNIVRNPFSCHGAMIHCNNNMAWAQWSIQ